MLKTLAKTLVEPFPQVAQLYRGLRDQLDRNQSGLPTQWGFTFAGHTAMASGAFEPEETRLFRHLLQEVDILVNVGANVGYYCCHALSLGKRVIAVEPIARNVHYLLKNLRDNGWANQAEVYPVALGQTTDILEIYGGDTGASLVKGWASIPESYVTQVPILTLDRLLGTTLASHRALILVDIEGAECAMLQGAMSTLAHQPRPTWMVEISTTEHQPAGTPFNPHFQATFDLFFAHHYQAFTAENPPQPISRERVAQIVTGQLHLSTHNVIFR